MKCPVCGAAESDRVMREMRAFSKQVFAVIPKGARETQDGVALSSVRVPRPAGSSLTSLR
jgi:hypothetical protein